MEKRYRIKANIGKDKVLNVNFKQDIDLYEILSLNISKDDFEKLKRNNSYKFFSSDYGVIVGRVLANDAFGVPNAKVSVFIPISDEDKLRTDIKELYPYSSVTDYNRKNIRFNTLPEYSVSDCHTPVGTFPSKRLVLDSNTVLEIYDKYYKYTTVTNNAGDYMIFGVPVGKQTIHTDIDLSDIGVLSQIPSDFLSKGYTIDMFSSPSKFKKSTNLDNLAQIFSENASVNVYPFWGDKSYNEIAITRKDINIQYKFETTCVFIGSVITDSPNNSINHTCEPDVKMGEAGQLVTSEGTIEMIRKTVDDVVEEYNINGNKLIDSDGVFCYQIPMNLDFVGTDEYGNIVPTDNPKKGIATRARVRFRVTLTENGSESLTTHKARYLIPNNPDLSDTSITPKVDSNVFLDDRYYEFGTKTPDSCFRDLYWNKVYSVKNYIPRVQRNIYDREQHYLALKGINKKNADGINPLPFNKLNLNVTVPAYKILDLLKEIDDENPIKAYWKYLRGIYTPFDLDNVYESIINEMDGIGLDFYNDWLNGCLYFPNWYWYLTKKNDYNVFSKIFEKNKSKYNSQLCECKNNDGTTDPNQNKLYLVTNCSLVYKNTDLQIKMSVYDEDDDGKWRVGKKFINSSTSGSTTINSGIIKKFYNKDNAEIFYYAFGSTKEQIKYSNRMGGQRGAASLCTADNLYIKYKNKPTSTNFSCGLGNNGEPAQIQFYVDNNSSNNEEKFVDYVRLFSTDIILLGSLKDNDIHSIPKINYNFPITTSHIPLIGTYTISDSNTDGNDKFYDTYESNYNGMNWGSYWVGDSIFGDVKPGGKEENRVSTLYKYGNGLFFGINVIWLNAYDWIYLVTLKKFYQEGFPFFFEITTPRAIMVLSDFKTGPNAERLSELGVTFDTDSVMNVDNSSCKSVIYEQKDGFITSKEIEDNDSRALFASLNSNKLIGSNDKLINGYASYKLCYLYPTSFDGKMSELINDYTYGERSDDRCKDYIDFRLGSVFKKKRHFYSADESNKEYLFPLYDNSFYFYFGLNPGKTAIEKFYSNYMGKCLKEAENLPFIFSVAASSTQMCRDEGVIDVKITTPIATPYSIKLTNSAGKIIKEDKEQYSSVYSFTDLEMGRYSVTITDVNLLSVSETATISSNAVSIDCDVLQQMSYEGPDYSLVCEYENYGIISINSYILGNDGKKDIDELPQPDTNNAFKYAFYLDKVTIFFESQLRESLEDCICPVDESHIVTENKIRIKKPGSYVISISENNCDINNNSVVKTISSGNYTTLGINGVDLNFLMDENDTTNKSLFYDPTIATDNDYKIENLIGWFGVHNPSVYVNTFNENSDTVENKLKLIFDMSKSIYIESNDKNNVLTINTDGSDTLLRCACPVYENSSWDSDDKYLTFNNTNVITCNNKYPNIVSKNYVYGGEVVVNGNYEFNKKYNGDNANIYAGNYFACFSNNAEINNVGNECYRDDNYNKFNRIPLNTDDLFEYADGTKFCTSTNVTKQGISDSVFSRTGSTKPYFRTEFIDRRFDYNLIFITPTKYGNAIDDWNCARLAGYTYNGIEMAYTDVDKIIVSKVDNTEYTCDEVTGEVIFNDNKKRFYDSKIVIGNNSYQIEDLYYSSKNLTPTSSYANIIKVVNHDESEFTDDIYKNFGLEDGKIVGYPTTRLIDLNIKEYGDKYTYSVTNCSYDINNVTINTAAKAGETTSCYLSVLSNILDGENIPGIKCEDINVSGPVNPLAFEAYFSNEFAAEAIENGYKYKIILDNAQHTEYKKLRTATTVNFDELITNDFPTSAPYKVSLDSIGGYPYVGVLIKKTSEGDENNLSKKITLIDASTFYKINNFTCAVSRTRVTNNARTDIPSTSVSTEGTGTITIGDETYTVHVTSRGSTDPTEGTAHVTGDIFKIIFAGNNLNVDSVQCTLYRSGTSAIGTYPAEYSREENAYFVSSNEESSGHVIKMLIYVKIDGLVYYFNVNNLNS